MSKVQCSLVAKENVFQYLSIISEEDCSKVYKL